MILGETGTMRSFFLGELGGWSKGDQDWVGDKVDVLVESGMVRLQIVGEKDWDGVRKLKWSLGL